VIYCLVHGVKQVKDWESQTTEQNVTPSPRNLRQLSITTADMLDGYDTSIVPVNLGIITWIKALEWVQDSPLQSLMLYRRPTSSAASVVMRRHVKTSLHADDVNRMTELVLEHCRGSSMTERLTKLIISGVALDEIVIERIVHSGISLEYLGTMVSNDNSVS